MRTEYCGNITKEYLGKDVSICGWVHRRRDHGGVIFLDIRDLEGICQAVIDPSNDEAFFLIMPDLSMRLLLITWASSEAVSLSVGMK